MFLGDAVCRSVDCTCRLLTEYCYGVTLCKGLAHLYVCESDLTHPPTHPPTHHPIILPSHRASSRIRRNSVSSTYPAWVHAGLLSFICINVVIELARSPSHRIGLPASAAAACPFQRPGLHPPHIPGQQNYVINCTREVRAGWSACAGSGARLYYD